MSNRLQHIIPQFYLKPFLSPGWVYRRGADAPRAKQSPASVAVQPYYYGQDEVGRKTLDDLNKRAESDGAPALRKLIDNPSTITQHNWLILSYLFANFAVRTPAVIEELRSAELKATTQINAMAEKMTGRLIEASLAGSDLSEFRSEPDDESPTFTLDQLNKHTARLREKAGHLLAANDLFSALPDIAECIQQMAFWILGAPDHLFFATSDRPLTLQRRVNGSRVGAGWKNPDALGSIALCPSRFLLMFYAKYSGVWQTIATPEQVEGLNVEVIRFADQEIYSPSKSREADDWMKRRGRWSSKG